MLILAQKTNKTKIMYCYLYVESKVNKGFQFIPCNSELFFNTLKAKIDKIGMFNTSKIELC